VAGRTEKEREKDKVTLRRQGLLKRERQTLKEIQRKSRLIQKKLFAQVEFKKAKTVMFYIAKSGEVETEEMIKESLKNKKKVVVPKVNGDDLKLCELLNWNDDLKIGTFGIKEPKEEALRPVALEEIDLMIAPGISFDLKGNRLGYGRGYFDRLLAKLSKRTKVFGLAFDLQIVEDVPSFFHDRALNKIITEQRIIERF